MIFEEMFVSFVQSGSFFEFSFPPYILKGEFFQLFFFSE